MDLIPQSVPKLMPQNVHATAASLGTISLPIVPISSAHDSHQIPTGTPASSSPNSQPLVTYYDALLTAYGPQKWWPGRSRFEIIVGAILTQNTSWTNVERAISNLREARVLSANAVHRIHFMSLAKLLRPSGYYRQKTKTLKSFVNFLYRSHGGSLTRMFATPTPVLRDQLLGLRGIGPETADSILLYAGKHPVFVVDAYARRILQHHGHADAKLSYDEIRKLFESAFPSDHHLFNEFHALIVHVGKNFCRPNNPCCSECALSRFLPQSIQPPT